MNNLYLMCASRRTEPPWITRKFILGKSLDFVTSLGIVHPAASVGGVGCFQVSQLDERSWRIQFFSALDKLDLVPSGCSPGRDPLGKSFATSSMLFSALNCQSPT